jgi:putative glycosyltransferase (TIGR04372 family)
MASSLLQRAGGFVVTQVAKTIAQPSRLFTVPLHFFRVWSRPRLERTLPRHPKLVPLFVAALPDSWLSDAAGKSFWNAVGYDLFQQDHPAPAWLCLERSIRAGNVTTDEYLLGAMCLYHGLGRFNDAMALFARANDLNVADMRKRGLDTLPYRVLDNVWGRHIGHTATIDYVIKLGILEGRERNDTIFYLPRGSKIANPFLLSQVAQQVRLIDDPAELPFDPDAVQSVHFNYLGPRLPDGTTFYFSKLANATYKRWHAEGRGTLFTLPSDIEQRGWTALQKAGMPQGGWFVALHVREGKWDGQSGGLHGILNCDIDTYMLAIEEITRRGGWVVRMGDPGMKRLPPLPNVIDYCHSDWRSDWLDVFLAARCRFMIGTSSGPVFVPPIYGVPSILTNWWPPAERAWHASDIFIPKMPRRIADGKYLTLGETLSEPYSWCHSRRYLSDHEGVVVEENESELIRAAVEEMFGRLAGEKEADEIRDLRSRADKIYESHGASGMGQLSREFLRRYESLIT